MQTRSSPMLTYQAWARTHREHKDGHQNEAAGLVAELTLLFGPNVTNCTIHYKDPKIIVSFFTCGMCIWKCAHKAHDVSCLLVPLRVTISLFNWSSQFLSISACMHSWTYCFMYRGIHQFSKWCVSTQEHEMLTPEGKKVPTRGRGMSAKKTPG